MKSTAASTFRATNRSSRGAAANRAAAARGNDEPVAAASSRAAWASFTTCATTIHDVITKFGVHAELKAKGIAKPTIDTTSPRTVSVRGASFRKTHDDATNVGGKAPYSFNQIVIDPNETGLMYSNEVMFGKGINSFQ